MAIIDKGEILLEAEPLRAIDELHGRIWSCEISREALPDLEREHAVISTKLYAGRTVAHVYSEMAPSPDFESVKPDLEDVYFSTIRLRAARFDGQVPPALGGRTRVEGS
jgi:hypothetical protein